MFDLVIFDCDGVLIDSEIISAKMLRAEALKLGIDISIDHILKNYVGRSYPTVLAEIQERFNLTLPQDFEMKYRTRLLEAFETQLNIIPYVYDVIQKLKIPYCIATSSSPRRVNRSLELVGLSELFIQNIFTASQVKRGKPAPDLFLFAATSMGAIPENTMVIEDSESGVAAGLAANMFTVRFMGGAHLENQRDNSGANLVFKNFNQFFDHFPDLKR